MKTETGHLNINSKSRHWLFSKRMDLGVLFLPLWVIWLVIFLNQGALNNTSLPLWAWVIFILGIDVSHVWSSLFRTYLNKEDFTSHRRLLIIMPFVLLALSSSVLYFSQLWFWRIMAYIAVFHFIKQQYGFIALYNFRLKKKPKKRLSDKLIIYLAAIYPVIYWHFNSSSTFNWFVNLDFLPLYQLTGDSPALTSVFHVLNAVYWVFILGWLVQEITLLKENNSSKGKILWVLTTAVNWWFGIVYFNSDVIFSITNVVAHGVPYIALIYYYQFRKREIVSKRSVNIRDKVKIIAGILSIILVIALTEEYLWDMLVNRDKGGFFEQIWPYTLEQVSSNIGLVIVIAILALPQQLHYITDGFIWKMNPKNKFLKPIFSQNNES